MRAKKILVADDDEELVEIVKDRIEASGYEVICAFEGVETFEKAKNEHPDLILLDWKMPAGKGSAVLEMLAEREDTCDIPVIILSGVDEPGMIETARHLGVKAVLRKPFDHHILIKTIAEALDKDD